MPSDDFDPFDPDQVSALPDRAVCKDGCKAKMEAWIDPAGGWGCCAPSLISGFAVMDDLKKFHGTRTACLLRALKRQPLFAMSTSPSVALTPACSIPHSLCLPNG